MAWSVVVDDNDDANGSDFNDEDDSNDGLK